MNEQQFLEWCAANNYEWQLSTCEPHPHSRYTTRHIVLWVHRPSDDFEIETDGATPDEARASAMDRVRMQLERGE